MAQNYDVIVLFLAEMNSQVENIDDPTESQTEN